MTKMKLLLIILVGLVWCTLWLYVFYLIAIEIESLEWYQYILIQAGFLASMVGLYFVVDKIKSLKI
jgi:hypothetical protein